MNNQFISEGEFKNRYVRQVIPYEGFIKGKGYASFWYDTIFPTTNNPHGKIFWDRYPQTILVQTVNSSDYMKERSWNVSTEDISKLLVRTNPDGTMTVNLGINREITLSKQYGKCQIKIEDTGSEVNVHVAVADIRYENGVKNEIGFTQSCRLKDFHHVFEPVGSYFPGGMDILETGVNEFGIMAGASGAWLKHMSKDRKKRISQIIYEGKKYLKKVHDIKIDTPPKEIKKNVHKGVKRAGKALSRLGLGFSIASAVSDNRLTAGDIVNVAVAGACFIPVAGWVIGGVYFIGDIVTEEVTGYSIGELIDNRIGEDAVLEDDLYDLLDRYILEHVRSIFYSF
jgi:hypothetical protein